MMGRFTSFDFRRTMTALTFCGAGVALSALLGASIYLVQADAPLVYRLAVGLEILLGIVMVGLAMTVALRQISGKFGDASFSASGGDDTVAAVTTTTTTAVAAVATGDQP
jgi:hypothetical protein